MAHVCWALLWSLALVLLDMETPWGRFNVRLETMLAMPKHQTVFQSLGPAGIMKCLILTFMAGHSLLSPKYYFPGSTTDMVTVKQP